MEGSYTVKMGFIGVDFSVPGSLIKHRSKMLE